MNIHSKCNNEIDDVEMKQNLEKALKLMNKAHEIHQDDLVKAKDLYA
jgi:hypothetical protein